MRGRTQDFNDIIKDEKEIWAVGQHNFLSTPLLDFTTSPYVAAYFAFYEKENDTNNRVIYAVSQKCVISLQNELEILNPLSNYNSRLISQSGLFVKFNTQKDLSILVEQAYLSNPDNKIKIWKIKIKDTEREVCLKSLNKMNINHNTLFPDLYGASLFCNLKLEITNY
jgi:hypothetical protein